MKITLASNNPHKLHEIRALIKDQNINLITQRELGIAEIEENGLSFIENALLKARHAALYSGLPAIADDSGLVIEALKGAPGVHSARYAGMKASAAANIEKVLTALETIPDSQRNAFFYCVIVYLSSPTDPTPRIFEGEWHGHILRHPRGTNGFGYDPIFYVQDLNQSAAELSLPVKNTCSHRAIALQKFINYFANTAQV